MNAQQIIYFIYSGETIDMHCSTQEIMKDIIKRFCDKINVNKNTIYCLYSGKKLDENITLENLKKSQNINEKTTILVYSIDEKDKETVHKIIKSSTIICPNCKEIATIKFNNYKLFFNCKNNHNIKNVFLKDFENSQKIDESKIICQVCEKINKSNCFNKDFYICLYCKKNLCPICKSSHDKNHNTIKYERKNYICFKHEDNFCSYCRTCKCNLCIACENDHFNHDTISLGKIFPKQEELNNKMYELTENISRLKEEIKNIIDILNEFMENINIYYNITNDINYSFNIKSKNYEILNNIQEINNNEVLNDIYKIINQKNICDKFNNIYNIYTKINSKEDNNLTNINMNFGQNIAINKMTNINNMFNTMNLNDINRSSMNFNNNNLNNNLSDINNNFTFNSNNIQSNNTLLNPNMIQIQNSNNNNNYLMTNYMNNNTNLNGFNNVNKFNYNEDKEWSKGFKLAKEEINKTVNISFRTINGIWTHLTVNYGTTIDQLLKDYLEKINKPFLIFNNKYISFLFNACSLKFGDYTPIEKKFVKYLNIPKVIINVNDMNNIIGAPVKNFSFRVGTGFSLNFYFSVVLSVGELLKYYFIKVGKEELFNNNNIFFIFNADKIRTRDFGLEVGNYFKYNENPVIIVNDQKNLINNNSPKYFY